MKTPRQAALSTFGGAAHVWRRPGTEQNWEPIGPKKAPEVADPSCEVAAWPLGGPAPPQGQQGPGRGAGTCDGRPASLRGADARVLMSQ